MIRLFVSRLRPQCISPPLKGPLALYDRRRHVHTAGAAYEFEVETTPLLRIVRNRVSEFANLRSEVSCSEHFDRISIQRTPHSCPALLLPEMILRVLNG